MTQEKLQLYFGVLIRHGTTMTLFNQLPKRLMHSLPPSLDERFFHFIFFLVFDLTSSFITLYFSNSFKISRNSSSVTLLSFKALEMCKAIVFNFVEAIILIFSCFSALDVDFFTLYLPIILSSPLKSDTPSITMTIGAATIVDNKATPPAPPPRVIVLKTVSNYSSSSEILFTQSSLVVTSFCRND